MPKVSNQRVHIYTDEHDTFFNYSINYDSKTQSFYANIPAQFENAFKDLSDEQLEAFGGREKRERGSWAQKPVIMRATEDEVKTSMAKALKMFMTIDIKKEPVIVIFYANNNDQNGSESLPNIGLELKAEYCHRVTACGGLPKFWKYRESEFLDEMRTTRQEIDMEGWRNQKNVVIPDTPENRAFVEKLHKTLKILAEKLGKFTNSPEILLDAISKNQKLLS
jgi:hypothetical protein